MELKLLDGLTNMFGPMAKTEHAKLRDLIIEPTETRWEECYSIILRGDGKFLTLWQAVIAIDPTFPRTGPLIGSRKLESWSRIPDRDLIISAIRYAQRGGGQLNGP